MTFLQRACYLKKEVSSLLMIPVEFRTKITEEKGGI
jgi:hypothetical protein